MRTRESTSATQPSPLLTFLVASLNVKIPKKGKRLFSSAISVFSYHHSTILAVLRWLVVNSLRRYETREHGNMTHSEIATLLRALPHSRNSVYSAETDPERESCLLRVMCSTKAGEMIN